MRTQLRGTAVHDTARGHRSRAGLAISAVIISSIFEMEVRKAVSPQGFRTALQDARFGEAFTRTELQQKIKDKQERIQSLKGAYFGQVWGQNLNASVVDGAAIGGGDSIWRSIMTTAHSRIS